MADLHHEIPINAPARDVWDAITTQQGLSGWWTQDSVVEPLRVGSVVELGFDKRALVLRLRLDEATPLKRMVWYCTGGDDEWKGTRLIWTILEQDGVTTLHLLHGYWRSHSSKYAKSNTIWGELMHRLKDYIEGRHPGPRWKE